MQSHKLRVAYKILRKFPTNQHRFIRPNSTFELTKNHPKLHFHSPPSNFRFFSLEKKNHKMISGDNRCGAFLRTRTVDYTHRPQRVPIKIQSPSPMLTNLFAERERRQRGILQQVYYTKEGQRDDDVVVESEPFTLGPP